MKPLQIIILIFGIFLCLAWVFMTWPGSHSHGHFYAYPVTLPLFGFWVIGWIVILVTTFFVVKRLKKK